MEKSQDSLVIGGPEAVMPSGLSGDVKNVTGVVNYKFLEGIEKLMAKYKVNYIQLYWAKFD